VFEAVAQVPDCRPGRHHNLIEKRPLVLQALAAIPLAATLAARCSGPETSRCITRWRSPIAIVIREINQ